MATDNEILFQQIGQYLTDMDLGGLFTVASNGQPRGWLWSQITSGVDSEAAIMISLEQTEQFKQRYGVIAKIREQATQGKAVHVPTVAEVREYEQTVASVMRQANIPSFMYDSYQDLQDMMVKGLSAVEVEQRLGQTWERVANTDPAVRDAYAQFFGIQGDAALAATYLDPTRTMASLERMSRTAYTAGQGSRMGINIDQATADRVAGLPKTDAGIYQDLTQIAGIEGSGILTESIGEAGKDLTTKDAQDSIFFGNGQSQAELERRQIERQAARAAVPGGAARNQQGLIGAGIART